LYIFALRAGKITIFEPKVVIFTARNTKFANFTGAYFLHFTTFSNQSLQFYSFQDALSSCGVGFRSSCLDQNLVYRRNHPLSNVFSD
jgi:hypothetical protein